MSNEADVKVNGVALTESQVIAMRVAVSSMLWRLIDPVECLSLGQKLADEYRARLSEVEDILIHGAEQARRAKD